MTRVIPFQAAAVNETSQPIPGPTEGNRSTPPTSSELARGGRARSRLFVSTTAAIDISSKTSREFCPGPFDE